MSIFAWILLFTVNSLFWKWILGWGGAEWLEGWKSFFVLDWFTVHWNAEQIRLYALLCWIGNCIWFLAGLFIPDLRFL